MNARDWHWWQRQRWEDRTSRTTCQQPSAHLYQCGGVKADRPGGRVRKSSIIKIMRPRAAADNRKDGSRCCVQFNITVSPVTNTFYASVCSFTFWLRPTEDLEDVDVSLQYNWLLFIYLLCRVFLKNKISLSMESVSLTFHRPEQLLFFPANN